MPIQIPNSRLNSDVRMALKLLDSGVAVDWSTAAMKHCFMVSEEQGYAYAGRCNWEIDQVDPTVLHAVWPADRQMFKGVHRVVVQIELAGGNATYDKRAVNVVGLSDVTETIYDSDETTIELSVEQLDTSVMAAILAACQEATAEANEAAAAAGAAVAVLQGGQTGQVLAKRSNAPLDFEWKTAEETPILQEEGQRTDAAMSQKAVTDSLAGKQAVISDLSQIRERANEGHTALQPSALNPYRTAQAQDFIDEMLLGTVNAKYTKPNTGIPKFDLADGVQSSLGKADSALQDAPSDGKQYLRKDGAWSEVDTEGVVIQVAELPAAASKALGTIVQYVGETTDSFTNGYFYKVVFVRQGSLFIHGWERTDVQPGTSGEISASNVIFDDEEDAETKVTELEQEVGENTEDIEAMKANLDRFGDVHAQSIDLDNLPKVCGYDMFIISTGAPTITPDFIGQIYIDTSGGKVYMATATTNSASFKALN